MSGLSKAEVLATVRQKAGGLPLSCDEDDDTFTTAEFIEEMGYQPGSKTCYRMLKQMQVAGEIEAIRLRVTRSDGQAIIVPAWRLVEGGSGNAYE